MRKYFNVINMMILINCCGILLAIIALLKSYHNHIRKIIDNDDDFIVMDADLQNLSAKVKDTERKLKRIISEYKSLRYEANENENYYGKRKIESTSYGYQYNGNGLTYAPSHTSYQNPNYDPQKSAEYRKQKEKYNMLVYQFIAVKKEIKSIKSELNIVKTKLYNAARKNDHSDATLNDLNKKIDDLFEKYNANVDKIHENLQESVDCTVLESCIDVIDEIPDAYNLLTESDNLSEYFGLTNMDISIIESCVDGEITEAVMNRLLEIHAES
jgi:predicted  nucleic acid-binding Zn-ribbon protein